MTQILQGIVGSTAYGLATADSDIDMIGAHVAPTRDVLGFGLSKSQQTYVTTKPDTTSHEIGKYCSLALQCNPTVIELMWLNQHEVVTEVGLELVELRYHFLSTKRVRDAYCGYAVQQAKRLLRRTEEGTEGFGDVPKNRTAKHGRHCYRLLWQCQQLLTQEHLTIRLPEKVAGQVFEMGEWAARDPQAFHDHMLAFAHSLETTESLLDDHADRERIEDWLISVRAREPFGLL